MITIPTDFMANVSGTASEIFTDMAPVAVLAIGVFLAIIVMTWVAHLFTGKKIDYIEIDNDLDL